ncbi:HAMP domain-containing histidine kinase [Coleofasciculus sp. LEGE 07092]|nr:HAMP domain-containing histidine kinase [Coleofasciculus sp. LEGE 07081]MBE9149976.1 HAMP domain-containing histidine kinase [Coleofasciculus sp. LEGE 07092]
MREISGQPLCQDWELSLQPRNIQGFPSSISISAMYKQGKLTGLRWLIRDISDRKQVEYKVICQQLAKEKELSELKSCFINTVSHEFRTPLSVILNSVEMLEGYSDRLSEAKKSNHFHKVRLSIGYMVQLLEDILFYGKAEANKLEFNPAPLELEDFCQALVEELRVSAKEGQDIVFSSKCDRPSVCLDPKLLKQLLGNLLSNAIKYSSKGSKIQFKTICENSQVIFQIQDSGIGIPKEDIPHLFDPFHRAKNATTISGTGLGLTIVKKAVDLHRGTISVESEIGTGTTFTVTLPCSPTCQ